MQAVYGADMAFAAILADNSVVTWGHPEYGGKSSRPDELTVLGGSGGLSKLISPISNIVTLMGLRV